MEIRKQTLDELVKVYGYSKNQIKQAIPYMDSEGNQRYADLIVYDTSKKKNPRIVIEIKKHLLLPVMISQLEELIIGTNAEYGLLTDGERKHILKATESGVFLELSDIPMKLKSHEEFPLKDRLMPIKDFSYQLWGIADLLRGTMHPNDILQEYTKLVISKLVDELGSDERVRFWTTESDLSESKARNNLVLRFNDLLKDANDKFGLNLDNFKMKSDLLVKIVPIFQNYSFSGSLPQIKNAYLKLLDNVGGRRIPEFGRFPTNLVDFFIHVLSPISDETFLNISSGIGDVLIGVLNYFKKGGIDSTSLEEYESSRLIGTERLIDAITIAKILLLLSGYSDVPIYAGDLLRDSSLIENKVKDNFDVICTVPPFGLQVRDNILSEFEVSHGMSTFDYSGLLVEKCHSLLKPKGRLGIVVTEGFMFRPSELSVRQYILDNYKIRAVISIPLSEFDYFTSIRTNFIILEKIVDKTTSNYSLFIADLDEIQESDVELKLEKILEAYRLFENGREIKAPGIQVMDISHFAPMNWSVKNLLFERAMAQIKGVSLEEVCHIITGQPISSRDYIDDESGIPYIRIGDLSQGGVDPSEIKRISPTKAKSKKKLKPGDVLLSIKGTIGKIAIVQDSLKGAIASSQVVVLRPKLDGITSDYLYHTLSSLKLQKIFKQLSTSFTIPGLSISVLKNIKIPLPTKDHLEKISKIKQLQKRYEELSKEMAEINLEIVDLRYGMWNEE